MTSPASVSTCPRDGFPMINVDGRHICSVEYADEIVGGQRVVDAVEQDGLLHLIFENESSLPLTCPCCGGRLHLRSISLENLSQMLAGRVLEGFRQGEWVGTGANAERHPIFGLQFSGEEDPSGRTIQVHLDSIRRIAGTPNHRMTMPKNL